MSKETPDTEQELRSSIFSPSPTTRTPSWTYGYETLFKKTTHGRNKAGGRKERRNRRLH